MEPNDLIYVDAVADAATTRMNRAISTWMYGQVDHEEPLLSDLFTEFRHPNWTTDVGRDTPVSVKTRSYELHRRDTDTSDMFGSDFGMTVAIPEIKFSKTALLQSKVAENGSVVVEKYQLDDMLSHPLTRGRAFVLAADRVTGEAYVQKASKLLDEFPPGQDTHTFDTSEWIPFDQWLRDWLRGQHGRRSAFGSPNSIEAALKNYAVHHDQFDDFELPWIRSGRRVVPAEQLSDYWILNEMYSRQ